jgi:hypothetical protein
MQGHPTFYLEVRFNTHVIVFAPSVSINAPHRRGWRKIMRKVIFSVLRVVYVAHMMRQKSSRD